MYKVGDKVMVKTEKQLRFIAEHSDAYWIQFKYDGMTSEMIKLCGKPVTIKSIVENSNNIKVLTIEEDQDRFSWYEEWFYPLTSAGKVLYGN